MFEGKFKFTINCNFRQLCQSEPEGSYKHVEYQFYCSILWETILNPSWLMACSSDCRYAEVIFEAKWQNPHVIHWLQLVKVGSCFIDSSSHITSIHISYIYIYIIHSYINLLDSIRIYPCLAMACHSNSQSTRQMTGYINPACGYPESSSQVSPNTSQTYTVQFTNPKHMRTSL